MIDYTKPIFLLVLNPMRGNTEDRGIAAWSHSREQLEAFERAERVEPYRDPGPSAFADEEKMFQKTYRKGGPLEWFNTPEDSSPSYGPAGIIETASIDMRIRHATEQIISHANIQLGGAHCVG